MSANILHQLADTGNIVLQITANDLKEFVKDLYFDEQKKIEEALAKQREQPTLSRKDTANRLNVSLATLWKWARGGLPCTRKNRNESNV